MKIEAKGRDREWISQLRAKLSDTASCTCVYKGRNRLEKLNVKGEEVVAKIFGNSSFKSVVYAIRSTKARRSYQNALELTKRGISTPEPLAYYEIRTALGRLGESCYICRYDDSISLQEALEGDKKAVLAGFARFAAMLHEKGILHNDLNNTNVRVRKGEQGEYKFSVIDLNRMKFYPAGVTPPHKECFANLCRFSYLDEGFLFFADRYLEARRLDPSLKGELVRIKEKHEQGTERKKRFKSLFK